MFIIFMQGPNSPERVEFIPVPICHGLNCPIRDRFRFILHFRPIQISALYVLVPDTILVLFWEIF